MPNPPHRTRLRTGAAACVLVAAATAAAAGPADARTAAPAAAAQRAPSVARYGWTVTTVDRATGRPTIRHVTTGAEAAGLAHAAAERADGARTALAGGVPAAVAVEPTPPPAVPTAMSNDEQRRALWWLTRLQAEQIWPKHDGKGLLVAVIDSGLDARDADLQGLAVPGHSLLDGSASTPDTLGHGTAVTSVIAARANNHHGVAGLAQNVRIMPVKVFGDAKTTPAGDDWMIGQAIIWAVDHGARVVNMSLGSPTLSASTKAALDYATSRDVVVVAASGNEGEQGLAVSYPAAYPPVLAVGSLDSSPAREGGA